MKLKRLLKTNVILSFVTTLLILSIIDFSFVSPTNSKFKTSGNPLDEDGIKLSYKVGFYTLYREGKDYIYQIPVPTPDTNPTFIANKEDKKNLSFDIEFSFPRQLPEVTADVNGDNGIYDTYTITAPTGCTINNNAVETVRYEEPSKKITDDNEEEQITVTFHCDSTVKPPEKGSIKLDVKVEETIGDEGTFPYTDYSFTITEEYYNDVMGIVSWINPLPIKYSTNVTGADIVNDSQELYDQFYAWIEGYFTEELKLPKNSNEEQAVKEYLHMAGTDTAYQQYLMVNGSSWGTPIPGLKIDSTQSGSASRKTYTYTYKIEDNLVGYALTAREPNKKINMYFTTKNADEIETAFDYYLAQAGYTTEEIALIEEYITTRGGISKVILSGKVILGVRYDGENRISLTPKLLEYAESLKPYGSATPIIHVTSATMASEFHKIVNGLDIASATLKDRTEGNDNALYRQIGYSNIIKNNTNNASVAAKSFVDYYFSYDPENKYYIVTKIFSDVEKTGNTKNFYDFSVLSLPSSVDMYDSENDPSDPDKLTIQLMGLKSYVDENGNTVTVTEEQAKKNLESVAITLRKDFKDIGTLNEETGEIVDIWSTPTTYGLPTVEYDASEDAWIATFVVSKGYNDGWITTSPSEDTGNQAEANSVESTNTVADFQSVQESIEKVTNAVDTAAESVYKEEIDAVNSITSGANLLDSTENGTGLSMISSIMKFFLKK